MSRPGFDTLRRSYHAGFQALGRPALLVALVSAFALTIGAWRSASERKGQDYYQQPWAVPHALRHMDESDLWDLAARERMGRWLLADVGGGAVTQTPAGKERQQRAAVMTHPPSRPVLAVAGTPFFFAALAPIATEDFTESGTRYVALMFAALASSMLLLTRVLRLGATAGLVLYALVITSFEPIASEFRVWNVNVLLLAVAALTLAAVARGRPLLAGVILALGVAFKPTLLAAALALPCLWLVDRRHRIAARFGLGLVIGGAAAFVAGCLWVGRLDAWLLFARSLGQLTTDTYAMAHGNFGLGRWVIERTGEPHVVALFAVFGAPIAVAFGLRWWRRKHVNSDTTVSDAAAAIGLGLIVPLLTSPLAWLHYYTILLFPIVVAMSPSLTAERPWSSFVRQAAGAAALLLLCAWPVWIPVPVDAAMAKPFVVNLATGLVFLVMLAIVAVPRAGAIAPTPIPEVAAL